MAKAIEGSTPSRRSVLAGIATAPALAAPALANTGDASLRELWSQYLEASAAYRAADAAHRPARAAYDAEEPPCPPDVLPGLHFKAQRPLWRKHGLDVLYDAWNKASMHRIEIVAAIQEEVAEGLFGVGVKLAAQPFDDMRDRDMDAENAIKSALTDIDRFLGMDFLAALPGDWGDDWPFEDEDEDEEAVS